MKWLDRDTVRAPYMALCLDERTYLRAVRHCGIKAADPWLDESRQRACVHTYTQDGKVLCLVCLRHDAKQADPIEVACTLVHESVHVFQRLCDSIGENEPGREFEAYSIERIAERLMREFVRQTAPITKPKPPRSLGGKPTKAKT